MNMRGQVLTCLLVKLEILPGGEPNVGANVL